MYERENLMNPISRSGWTVGSRVPSWTWQTRLTNKQQLLDLDASEREMWASVHAECVRKAFLMAGALLKVLIIQKFTRICSVIQLFHHIRNAARYRGGADGKSKSWFVTKTHCHMTPEISDVCTRSGDGFSGHFSLSVVSNPLSNTVTIHLEGGHTHTHALSLLH